MLTKQTEWAKNRGIVLLVSKDERDRPLYVRELNENLFQPLSRDALSRHGGTKKINPDSKHHSVAWDRIKEWFNRWDLLKLYEK
jgi:hypothetical protein